MSITTRVRESLRRLYYQRQTRIVQTKYERYSAQQFDTSEALVYRHFETWSQRDHVNLQGFLVALQSLSGAPARIFETGTSAWGTDSTRLWDSYIRNFGGQMWSVDISEAPSLRLHGQLSRNSHLIVEDSIDFIDRFRAAQTTNRIDLCYLDSWDLDWRDPEPAEIHGFREWEAIKPLLGNGSILIVDDTPLELSWVPENVRHLAAEHLRTRGRLPGKGFLINQELRERPDVKKLWHGYNCVYLFGTSGDETE